MEDKKTYLIEKLILKLTEENNLVNSCIGTANLQVITDFQRRAFLTGKALRKLLK